VTTRPRTFSHTARRYLTDIRRFPILSRDEERRLLEDSAKGDPTALSVLVESNLPFVVRMAADLSHLGIPFEDLLGEGNLGLIEAARRFDLGRGTRFITYAADPRRPADWSHVAAQVELGHERWLTGDATQAESYLGWDPPPSRVWSTRTWPIDDEASPTRYEMEAVLKYSRGKTRS